MCRIFDRIQGEGRDPKDGRILNVKDVGKGSYQRQRIFGEKEAVTARINVFLGLVFNSYRKERNCIQDNMHSSFLVGSRKKCKTS